LQNGFWAEGGFFMIYFDNSATTKPYKEVLDSFVTVSSEFFGNPSSLHGIGGQAEKLLSQSREQIAKLLAVKPTEIFFTSGGTESNNMAIKGAAMLHKNRGRHIITSSIEHDSVSAAMELLEHNGFDITRLPVDHEGRVCTDDVKSAIREDTILVSIMHVNNEVGTIQPIEEIGEILKQYPSILFHVDTVQSIGKVTLPLKENRIDLCSVSSHKFHGLKGTGAIFIREGVRLAPLFSGGSQEQKYRSGTQNVAGAVSMAKALRITMAKSSSEIEKMKKVNKLLRDGLAEMEDVYIHTPVHGSAPHILNFSIRGVKSEVFIHALEDKGVYVSTTSACSSKRNVPSKTLLAMGVPRDLASSAIRISLSFQNTVEEAEKVIKEIDEAANHLRKVRK
jgi:cysteine desulfurase